MMKRAMKRLLDMPVLTIVWMLSLVLWMDLCPLVAAFGLGMWVRSLPFADKSIEQLLRERRESLRRRLPRARLT